MARYNRKDYETALPQLEKQTEHLAERADGLITRTKSLDTSIESLKTKTDNVFIIDTYTPSGYTFDPNQYRSLSRSITTHTGYTPIVVNALCQNKTALHVFNYYVSGGSVVYEVYNRTSSQITGADFSIKILWLKTALSG